MARDMHNNISATPALNPASITGTTNGIIIDTKGYESLEFVVNIGAVAAADANNYLTPKVQEGDQSNLGDAADVASTALLGAVTVINNTNLANTCFKFGVKMANNKRYYRLVFTETSTFEAILGAVAILGHPRH